MKHLGIDTNLDLRPLKRAFFLVGSFLFLSFSGAVLMPLPSAAQPVNTEFLQLDPEAVTHESLGMVTCLGRSPSDGALWIGMERDGVLRVGRNGRRIRYTAASGHLPSDSVKSIHFLADGSMYLLDASGHVVRYTSVAGFAPLDAYKGRVTALTSDASSTLFLSLDDGSILSGSASGAFKTLTRLDFVPVFLQAQGDRIYAAGSLAGQLACCTTAGELIRMPAPDFPLNCLAVSDQQEVWAGSDTGLFRLAEGVWRAYTLSDPLSSTHVTAMVFDQQNRLWISSWAGLCCADVSKDNVSKSEFFLPEQVFLNRSVLRDTSGMLYFGAVRGVVSVAADAGLAMSPWEDPAPEPLPKKHVNWLWLLLILPLLFAVGYYVGVVRTRRIPAPDPHVTPVFEPSQDHSEGPVTPVVAPVRARTSTKTSDQQTYTPDELIDKLESIALLPEDSFANIVYQIVLQHYTDPKFSVETIASELHLSRVHVNRKMQAELGISPSALIKAFRMRLATEMLASNEIPVAEIASRTGFSSPSYFSSAFKEFFGVSPKEYLSGLDGTGSL